MWLKRLSARPLCAPDTDGKGGEDEKEKDEQPRRRQRASDIQARHGDDSRRLAELLGEAEDDNYDLRRKNAKHRERIADLERNQVPEGAVVLSKDEAPVWEAYKLLGKPEDVKKAVDDGKAAGEKVATFERMDAVRAIAAAEGLNAEALAALPGGLPPHTLRDVEEGGAKKQRAYVTPEGKAEQPIRDWGKAAHPALWSAVETVKADAAKPAGTNTVKVPPQSTGNAGDRTAVQKAISKQYALPGQNNKQQ